MSRLQNVEARLRDSMNLDAFGRLRVSLPQTVFDGKQIFDNQPLFYDQQLESGAGITSARNADTASTVFTSTLNTAGVFTRQTFQRFNYQPGKSMLVLTTGILQRDAGGAGVARRKGFFDDENGLFFEDFEGVMRVVRRSNTSGTPVDDVVPQSAWNVDRVDGSGGAGNPSGITADWSLMQIFGLDFQWLGSGRIRMCLMIDGEGIVVHEFSGANSLSVPFMTTPNLPLRSQMVTTGASPASTMETVCAAVISEGRTDDLGALRYISTNGTHVDCNVDGTIYAILGMRLAAANIGATIKTANISIAELVGGNFYEWFLVFNPQTIAGTFTYSGEANSSVEAARGVAANVVTVGTGTVIGGGFASSARQGGNSTEQEIENALRLGAAIDGTRDQIVLCVRPVSSSNLEIEGSITYRELS